MISLEHASRWYGQVIGINDVTCAIPAGLTALLGPNGAGKSTLIKLVTGQLRPTTGSVAVLSENPFANPKVLRQLGYCPEIENCYEEMTGREFVTMLASLSGISREDLKARVADSIARVGMTENADRKIAGYSKGMRQRIKVAQAIVHDPQVMILDEPLNGLDPMGRRDISALLKQFADRGKCVLVSSHILYEVEQMTSNILLIHHGRLLAQGDVYHIRSLIDKHPHRISIRAADARSLARRVLELPYVLSVQLPDGENSRLELETRTPDQFYNQFPDLVLREGFVVSQLESPDNNLESVFRYLVNE